MIRSRVTQADSGARSTEALYHPLIRCHASWIKGGSAPTSASTSAPASSTHRLLSVVKLALMVRPSLLMIFWPFAVSRRAETLSSTSLHVAAKIHSCLLASRACAFGTALRRAAKILSSPTGSVGSRRGSFFRPPRYCMCSFREALCRQPRTKTSVVAKSNGGLNCYFPHEKYFGDCDIGYLPLKTHPGVGGRVLLS